MVISQNSLSNMTKLPTVQIMTILLSMVQKLLTMLRE